MIYLDNASTTYPKPECSYRALEYGYRNCSFNASRGSYEASKAANRIIDNARQEIGGLIGTSKDNVIFSSSATEALNQIIYGLNLQKGDNVFISPFEHNSIVRTLNKLKESIGVNLFIIPFIKSSWECDIEKMHDMFVLYKPKAVIISHVSNATGYVLPYENIFKEAQKYNSITLLDCAQSFGICSIKAIENINYIVFAGHKTLYSCFGIAGFIKLKKDRLNVVKCGGTGSDSLNADMPENTPSRYEAGSSNITAIYCLLETVKWVKKTPIIEHEKELTNYLISELTKLDNVRMFLPKDFSRIIGIVSFVVDGYSPDEVGKILDEDFQICVRTGYHCAPLIHKFIGSDETLGTVRVSLGYFNCKKDIDMLVLALMSL